LKNRKMPLVVLAIGLVLFAIGVAKLFIMRFEAGDVYPPYSSLRSDPLGAKALFESIEKVEGISVLRNYRPLSNLGRGQERTFFYLGVNSGASSSLKKTLLADFDQFVVTGGRLIISFLPEIRKPEIKKYSLNRKTVSGEFVPPGEEGEAPKDPSGERVMEGHDEPSEIGTDLVFLEGRWRVGLGYDIIETVFCSNIIGLMISSKHYYSLRI